jgi:hypothetical protein
MALMHWIGGAHRGPFVNCSTALLRHYKSWSYDKDYCRKHLSMAVSGTASKWVRHDKNQSLSGVVDMQHPINYYHQRTHAAFLMWRPVLTGISTLRRCNAAPLTASCSMDVMQLQRNRFLQGAACLCTSSQEWSAASTHCPETPVSDRRCSAPVFLIVMVLSFMTRCYKGQLVPPLHICCATIR